MKDIAKRLKPLLKNKKIIDIIIFGSTAKGKVRPADLDLAILADEEIDKLSLREKTSVLFSKPVHLQFVTLRDYDSFFLVTLIREGYSVKHGSYLSEIYKLKPVVLYKYDLRRLTPSQKVLFLRGLSKFNVIEKVANRMVLVPTSISGEFESFLRYWKIDLDAREYSLLPLVRHEG